MVIHAPMIASKYQNLALWSSKVWQQCAREPVSSSSRKAMLSFQEVWELVDITLWWEYSQHESANWTKFICSHSKRGFKYCISNWKFENLDMLYISAKICICGQWWLNKTK